MHPVKTGSRDNGFSRRTAIASSPSIKYGIKVYGVCFMVAVRCKDTIVKRILVTKCSSGSYGLEDLTETATESS